MLPFEAPLPIRPSLRLLLLLCALLFALLPATYAQTGLFPNPVVIPTGNWPAAVYTADINNDGIADLIYLDQGAAATGSTTHILLGTGKGQFAAPTTLGTFGQSLAIGDYLGSHLPEILSVLPFATGPGSTLPCAYALQITSSYLRGSAQSQGSVSQSLCVSAAHLPVVQSLAAAHLLNSPFDDLVVQDSANSLLYVYDFQGFVRGLPIITYAVPIPVRAGPVAFADLNGDGNLDMLVSVPGTTSVFAYLSNGLGGFSTPATTHFANGFASILLRDVNNDGRPDLIAEGANGRIDVYPGKGDGTFQTSSIGGTGTLDGLTGNGGHLIAASDLNHDGQLDALTSTPIGVSALLGQGTAYLGLKGIFNAGPGMHTFATADFNGDGNLDLATDSPEGIAILYGNPDGTFQTNRAYAAGAPAQSGALGLFTSSGKLDAAVASGPYNGQFLAGQGDGTFRYTGFPGTPVPVNPALPGTGSSDIAAQLTIGDVDGDGKPDLIFTGEQTDGLARIQQTPGLGVFYGTGAGNFGGFTLYNYRSLAPGCAAYPPVEVGASVVADFDADGTMDIANRSADGVRVIYGGPGKVLARMDTLLPSPSACQPFAHQLLAAGSFGLSARPDLVVQQNSSLLLFSNRGTRSFAQQPLGDLSADGSLTTPGQRTAPDLSPTFGGPSVALGFHAAIGSMLIADLDGDGNADLLVVYDNFDADHTAPTATAPNYVYLWFGDGTGHFPVSSRHPVNPVRLTPSRNFYQAAVADLNHDGHPDLLLSDGYLLSVQFGDGTGAFGPEQHFLAGQGINSLSPGDLRGVGRQDLVLANGGTVLGNPVANRDVFTPNPDVATGGITVLLNTPQTASPTTSGTFAASPEPSPFEASVALTTTLNPNSGPAPTGTVNFLVSGGSAGTATLSSGSATLTLAAPFPAYLNGKPLLPGTYPLTAIYSGDGNYSPATLTASHTVLLGPTSVLLTPTTPLQTYYGQPVDGTFAVTVVDSNYGTTGTYTLFDNGAAVPICTNLPLTLNGKPLACPYGNPIFLDAGPHVFSVVYNGGPANGDPVNASSAASNTISYTVLPDITAAGVLTSSLNPSTVGQAVTFSAAFTSNVAIPTGTVRFLDGTAVLGTATLSATGVATFTTSSLAVGTHPITALYDRTQDFTSAVSATLNQVVLAAAIPPAAPFTLTVTPNPIVIGAGRTGVLAVVVTSPLPVALTCTDTFAESACLFLQPAIPAGGGATELQVTTAAPHDCSDPDHPYFLGPVSSNRLPGRPAAAFAALTACVLLARKRRRLAGVVFALAVSLALSTLSGCGHCTDLGTRPGNYSFSVLATASDGSTRQVTVPVRVKIPGE